MRVDVIRAWPHRFESVGLDLPAGATVGDALAASGFVDAGHPAVAIHGVIATPDTFTCVPPSSKVGKTIRTDSAHSFCSSSFSIAPM